MGVGGGSVGAAGLSVALVIVTFMYAATLARSIVGVGN